jgi:hypothetical protein
MNLQAEKLELVRMILDVEDKSILKRIKSLIETEEDDFWDELHDDVKAGIEEGIAQLERGEGIPHEEAIKRLKRW